MSWDRVPTANGHSHMAMPRGAPPAAAEEAAGGEQIAAINAAVRAAGEPAAPECAPSPVLIAVVVAAIAAGIGATAAIGLVFWLLHGTGRGAASVLAPLLA